MLDLQSHSVPAPFVTLWIRYTPELAAEILANWNSHNRGMRSDKLIAQAMAKDDFAQTHQAIAFDVAGILLDGQNRLSGIVKSGKEQVILTVLGLPSEAQANMDKGSRRTDAESLLLGYGRDVNRVRCAIARAMVLSPEGTKNWTMADLDRWMVIHWQAITCAHRLGATGNKRGWSSAMRATLARAYYSVPEARLTEFVNIVNGGPFQECDRAAAALGNHIRVNRLTMQGSIGFYMCQRALLCFLHGRPVQQIKPLVGNYFPLPGETADPLPKEFAPGTADHAA